MSDRSVVEIERDSQAAWGAGSPRWYNPHPIESMLGVAWAGGHREAYEVVADAPTQAELADRWERRWGILAPAPAVPARKLPPHERTRRIDQMYREAVAAGLAPPPGELPPFEPDARP